MLLGRGEQGKQRNRMLSHTQKEERCAREVHRLSIEIALPRERVVQILADATGLTEAGPETTLWKCENEYRFSGVPMRLVGLLVPDTFRKQSRQHMQDSTAFAEQGKDVREESVSRRSRHE
ncbi:hypothetical protein [Amycolatopsis antarctica]|uniref:hypothetical protein n=1 Tax=Amycolatopsis antarctica TaxID=1854586 RepID=UPI00196A5080|nr:hypothetical protein [Amycolatopsis antarctica]